MAEEFNNFAEETDDTTEETGATAVGSETSAVLEEISEEKSKEEAMLTAGEAEFFDALRLGNIETATHLLEEYKIKNGKNAFYQFRLAALTEKKGDVKIAYDIFKKLYFENPAFMMGHNDYLRLSQLYIKDPFQDIDKEIKRTQAEFYKGLEKKRMQVAQAHDDSTTVPDSTPYEFWRNNAPFLQSITKRLEKLMEFEENDVDVLNCLLKIYTDTKNQDNASWYKDKVREAVRLAKELIAKRSLSALGQASKLESTQKYEAAIDVVNLGIETDPCNLDLNIFKCEVLQKMGCLKDALSVANGILRIDINNSQAHRLKKALESQIMEDNLSVGFELLQKAEQDAPGSPSQTSKLRSAYSLLLEVIGYDEENLVALAGIYLCNIRMSEPLKAQKILERIREIDENFDVYSVLRSKKNAGKQADACFVATRVYGAMHPNTVFLRGFRDNFLRRYFLGRVFITLYHNVGPSMARLPEKSPVLKLSRLFIQKLVTILKKLY